MDLFQEKSRGSRPIPATKPGLESKESVGSENKCISVQFNVCDQHPCGWPLEVVIHRTRWFDTRSWPKHVRLRFLHVLASSSWCFETGDRIAENRRRTCKKELYSWNTDNACLCLQKSWAEEQFPELEYLMFQHLPVHWDNKPRKEVIFVKLSVHLEPFLLFADRKKLCVKVSELVKYNILLFFCVAHLPLSDTTQSAKFVCLCCFKVLWNQTRWHTF